MSLSLAKLNLYLQAGKTVDNAHRNATLADEREDDAGEDQDVVQPHAWHAGGQDRTHSRTEQCVPSTSHQDSCSHYGLSVGRISLPSTTLRFFDLGGQRDIRSIWPRYYDECHAVVFVLDACDQARLSETWAVFGEGLPCSHSVTPYRITSCADYEQTRSSIPLGCSISLYSYWRTSRTVPRRSLSPRSGNRSMRGIEQASARMNGRAIARLGRMMGADASGTIGKAGREIRRRGWRA